MEASGGQASGKWANLRVTALDCLTTIRSSVPIDRTLLQPAAATNRWMRKSEITKQWRVRYRDGFGVHTKPVSRPGHCYVEIRPGSSRKALHDDHTSPGGSYLNRPTNYWGPSASHAPSSS